MNKSASRETEEKQQWNKQKKWIYLYIIKNATWRKRRDYGPGNYTSCRKSV